MLLALPHILLLNYAKNYCR